jgi:O-antigen/teichoic acid export membrane protein
MSISITKSDILWSYVGYAMSYGINLLLLPFMLRYLSRPELGLWYTFSAINYLVLLLDFGFMPTILRNASFAWDGTTTLIKEGLAPEASSGEPNFALLRTILQATRLVYLWIATGALVLMALPGVVYLHGLLRQLPSGSHGSIWLAWAIFCLGVFCNLYYSYWAPMLRGVGAIKENNQAMVIAKLAQLAVTILGLVAGYGLIAAASGFLFSGLVTRQVSRLGFFRYEDMARRLQLTLAMPAEKVQEIIAIIWHGAHKQGIVSLGMFMIRRVDLLVCSSFLGLAVSAEYGLTQQIFTTMASVAAILFNSYLPLMHGARLRGDQNTLRTCYALSTLVAWLTLIAGTLFLVVAGQGAIHAIKGLVSLGGSHEVAMQNTATLVTPAKIAFIGMFTLFEINHQLFYGLIITGNRIMQPRAYLITGACMAILDILCVKCTSLGLWGLLYIHFLCQLAYNNWKWPLIGLRELDMTLLQVAQTGAAALGRRVSRLAFRSGR